MAWWQNFYHSAINQLSLFGIADIIDIAVVSYIVYRALKFIRDTKTFQLLKGVIIVVVVTQISYFAKLNVMYYILSNFLQLGVIALLIVFQPELRRILEHAGRSTNGKWFANNTEVGAESLQVIREVAKAAQLMSKDRVGALIVIEHKDNVDSLISSGVRTSARVSSELLETLTAGVGDMRVVKLYAPLKEEKVYNRVSASVVTFGDRLDASGMVVLSKK